MPRHSSDPFHPPHKTGSRACIGEFRVLGSGASSSRLASTLGRTDEALELLRAVADEVGDVMRKHGWWTLLLTEFSGFTKANQHTNTELLGMNKNRGQVIYLRLRYPSSTARNTLTDSFLPMGDLLGTMLHELAHNVRGPHDDIFQKTLAELEEEYFESKRQRIGFGSTDYRRGGGSTALASTTSVKPFQGEGVKLGLAPTVTTSGRTPGKSSSSLQSQAALAAEQRRNAGKLPALTGGKAMAQLAAEAAARRRAQTQMGCASSRTEKEQESAVKWHEEEEMLHGVRVITIQDDSDDEQPGKQKACRKAPLSEKGKRNKEQPESARQGRTSRDGAVDGEQPKLRRQTNNAAGRETDIVVIHDSSDDDEEIELL